MRAKIARRIVKERDQILARAAAAQGALAAADAETDRLLEVARLAGLEVTARSMRLVDLIERRRELDAWEARVRAEAAFWGAEVVDCAARAEEAASESLARRRAAEGLLEKSRDPRFAEAQAVLDAAAARAAVVLAEKAAAPPLSPEAVEGLKLLARAFDKKAIRRPSHRQVFDEGGEADYDQEAGDLIEPCLECGAAAGVPCDVAKHRAQEVSIPCPECGAAVGEACDEKVKHEDDVPVRGAKK